MAATSPAIRPRGVGKKIADPTTAVAADRRHELQTNSGYITVNAAGGDIYVLWGDETVDADTSAYGTDHHYVIPDGFMLKLSAPPGISPRPTHVSIRGVYASPSWIQEVD